MSADRDEYENTIIAAGGVWALLWDALPHHNALAAAEVVTDGDGNATNQIEISLSFMNSPYRLTVERVQPPDRATEPVSADPMYPITAAINALGVHLSLWRRRGDVQRYGALGDAVADIDVALRELHQLRSQLVTNWADTGYEATEPVIVPTDTACQPE